MEDYVIPKKRGRRFLLFLFLVGIALAIYFFASDIITYFNILTGREIILTISASQQHFYLNEGDVGEVSFSSKVLISPFCNSVCSSEFKDLSSGAIVNTDDFNLNAAGSNSQSYSLISQEKREGQKIYEFKVKCKGVKNDFCKSDAEKLRSILITLDYGLDEEDRNMTQSLKYEILNFSSNVSYFKKGADYFDLNLAEFNKTLDVDNFSSRLSEMNLLIDSSQQRLEKMKSYYESQRYYDLRNEVFDFQNSFAGLKNKFAETNNLFDSLIISHNSYFDGFSYLRNKLEALKESNLSLEGVNKTNSLINTFNKIIINKSRYDELSLIVSEVEDFNFTEDGCCSSNLNITAINFSKIKKFTANASEINLIEINDPRPICCYLGSCDSCCEGCSGENFPVILLHGHNVYNKASAERSLDTFQFFQEKLEEDGFINGGILFLGISPEEEGVFSRLNFPVSFRTSYYFDLYDYGESSTIIQTKEDNIDTYAVRLKEIIKSIESKTGKNKVVVITHSMGGLVARRYIQIFGNEDVDKLIMIAPPNGGISGRILDYCKILGAKKECSDMDSQSLLISKLRGSNPGIPAYILIGIGCDMNGENGDGIVTNKSAYLDFAENYYFEGVCPGATETLHEHLLFYEEHPEVYDKVLEILKED